MFKSFIKFCVLVTAIAVSQALIAAQYVAGDLAPWQDPDGVLNVADLLILTQFVNGLKTPTSTETIVGDVGPLNSPDGVLDVRDVLILQRSLLGDISLSPIFAPPAAPILNQVTPTTTQNPFQITGTAQPNIQISLFVNNQLQQNVTSNISDGTFSFGAYLFDGDNIIHTVATDDDGSSEASNLIQVEYTNAISRIQGGSIIDNTVWTPGLIPEPYIITSNLTVDTGKKLVLMPGTVLQFASGMGLIINGELHISGDAITQVTLTSTTLTPGSWTGIIINSDNSEIDWAVIEYAVTGIEIGSGSSNTSITNSMIQNNSNRGIFFNYGSGVVSNNTISNNRDGIYVFNASPLISLNNIYNNRTGIYLDNASSQITGNIVDSNAWYGIDMRAASNPEIHTGNVIKNNGIGLIIRGTVSGKPRPIINGNEIYNNITDNISTGGYTNNGTDHFIDATGNWWGTTVVSDIAASIHDASTISSNNNSFPIINYAYALDAVNGGPIPFIYSVTQDVYTIDPLQNEIMPIPFNLSYPATVTLSISDEQTGVIIRTIVTNFSSTGLKSISWDGKDNSNNYVADGAYLYTLVANDGVTMINAVQLYPEFQGFASGTGIVGFSVMKNIFYKNLITTFGNSRVSFCVHPDPGPTLNCTDPGAITISNEIHEDNSSMYYWDGRDLNGNAMDSGSYRFYVPVPVKFPSNAVFIKSTNVIVSGEGVAPNIEVKSNPYLIRHSYEEFSQIKFQVSQNSNVTVKLLPPNINDPNDLSAIILMNSAPISANQLQTITWDGYLPEDTNNILVETEGMYTFTIEATSDVTGLKTLYRGAVTLYH